MLDHAWIIPALPAASFLLILFFGKRLPRKGSEIGIAFVGVAFVLALLTAGSWISRVGEEPAEGDEHAAAAQGEAAAPANANANANATDADEHADPAAQYADVDTSCSRTAAAASPGSAAGGDAGHESEGDHQSEGDGGHALAGPATGEAAAPAAPDADADGESEGGHHAPTRPVVRCVTWFQNGDVGFTVGTHVDGLSALMLVVVTLISLLVHIYSTDYVDGDRRYTHYFAFLSLFTASMLFFVLAENTLQMIVGWELVGVCSFALIGHWWEEKPNSDAALKAFITNRVGDVGLMIGMITLFWAAGGTFNVIDVNQAANDGTISHTVALGASLCLLAAVMSKSGQFFLHTWLPDAMAGPTPVSALIHAATMVVAGIYMVARLYGVFWEGFSIAGSSINAMAFIGGFTTLVGASLAFVQKDIKKVLAYSTISQLGYMVMALGVGAWTAAIFHLFTHAFFKACLFLGAGSMSHAAHHSFNMVDDYGGLKKYMPRTFWTYVIATGALAGIPPLAGFWSKDEILAGTGVLGDGNGSYTLMLVFGFLTAFMTAAYMTRTVWYSFFNGEYKGHGTPHEGGSKITVPLIILATLGALVGFINLPAKIFGISVPESIALKFEHWVEPVGGYFPAIGHAEFQTSTALISISLAVGGIAVSYLYFWKGLGPHRLTERNKAARVGRGVLENKYYLDWLYTDVIVRGVKFPIAKASNWINQNVIDGAVNAVGKVAVKAGIATYDYVDQGVVDTIVDGTGAAAEGSGQGLRRSQTGRVQQYAAMFFAGAALLAGIFILVLG